MSDATLELPVERQRPALQHSQLVLVFIAVAAAGFLLGIASATTMRPQPVGAIVAEGDVGADGRTIRFDGGQVSFPKGSVAADLHVVIRRSTNTDRLRVSHEDRPIVIDPGKLFAYRFEPANAVFTKPVELTFRFPDEARNGTVFVRDGDSIRHLTGTIDPARGTATVLVRDFAFGDA